MRWGLASAASECRRTTESTPPESAMQTDELRASVFAIEATSGPWIEDSIGDAAGVLLRAGFLELAITHQALEAFFHQQGRLLALQLPQRFGERLAKRLCSRFRIAV